MDGRHHLWWGQERQRSAGLVGEGEHCPSPIAHIVARPRSWRPGR